MEPDFERLFKVFKTKKKVQLTQYTDRLQRIYICAEILPFCYFYA